MVASRPTLVLISGAPGAGKTFLAQRLADELPVVVVEKDAIKESLFDTLGEADREWSMRLGAAAFALVRVLIQSHLRANQSIVVEAAFQPEFDLEMAGPFQAAVRLQGIGTALLHRHGHRAPPIQAPAGLPRKTQRTHIGYEHGRPHECTARSFPHLRPLTSGSGLVRIDTTDLPQLTTPL